MPDTLTYTWTPSDPAAEYYLTEIAVDGVVAWTIQTDTNLATVPYGGVAPGQVVQVRVRGVVEDTIYGPWSAPSEPYIVHATTGVQEPEILPPQEEGGVGMGWEAFMAIIATVTFAAIWAVVEIIRKRS